MPKKKKTNRKYNIVRKLRTLRAALAFSAVLIIFGLALVSFQIFSTWRAQQTSAAIQPIGNILKNNTIVDDQPYISGTPVQITLPSVNIDLKVIPGYYYPKSNSWTLTTNNAQWGVITKLANDKSGMTFIYAHYRKGVFLKLPKIKPGEVALVKTEKGHTFTYTFRSSTVTSPTDTSIFAYQGKPILVLQTCTGAWYQNRQLFVFDLTKVE